MSRIAYVRVCTHARQPTGRSNGELLIFGPRIIDLREGRPDFPVLTALPHMRMCACLEIRTCASAPAPGGEGEPHGAPQLS